MTGDDQIAWEQCLTTLRSLRSRDTSVLGEVSVELAFFAAEARKRDGAGARADVFLMASRLLYVLQHEDEQR